MKLGLGLYQHIFNKQHFAFAKQSCYMHLGVHLVDNLNKGKQLNQNSCTIKKTFKKPLSHYSVYFICVSIIESNGIHNYVHDIIMELFLLSRGRGSKKFRSIYQNNELTTNS